MSHIIICDYDNSGLPLSSIVLNNQEEVDAWFEKNSAAFPKAVHAKNLSTNDMALVRVDLVTKKVGVDDAAASEAEELAVLEKRRAEYGVIDGEGLEAMRKALVQIYGALDYLAPPPELSEYLDKVDAIKLKHPKGVAAKT